MVMGTRGMLCERKFSDLLALMGLKKRSVRYRSVTLSARFSALN